MTVDFIWSSSPPQSCLFLFFSFFFFFFLGCRKWSVCLTAESHWSFEEGFRGASTAGGPLLPGSYQVYEKPHLYSLFSVHSRSTCIHKRAHTHVRRRSDILLNGRALLLPQSMEYHICLFTPRFLSLNSINIYIAAEGVGSPSCSGGNSA